MEASEKMVKKKGGGGYPLQKRGYPCHYGFSPCRRTGQWNINSIIQQGIKNSSGAATVLRRAAGPETDNMGSAACNANEMEPPKIEGCVDAPQGRGWRASASGDFWDPPKKYLKILTQDTNKMCNMYRCCIVIVVAHAARYDGYWCFPARELF